MLTLADNYRHSEGSRCPLRVKWEAGPRSQTCKYGRKVVCFLHFHTRPILDREGCYCALDTYMTSDSSSGIEVPLFRGKIACRWNLNFYFKTFPTFRAIFHRWRGRGRRKSSYYMYLMFKILKERVPYISMWVLQFLRHWIVIWACNISLTITYEILQTTCTDNPLYTCLVYIDLRWKASSM